MFYDELKAKLEKLMQEENWDQALILIDEELNAPYIPADFEVYLQKAKATIIAFSQEEKTTTNPNQLSLDEIQKKLLSPDLVNQALALQALEHSNARLILEAIQAFCMSPNFSNENKTMLLLILQDQQITTEIQVNKNGKIFSIIPINLDSELLLSTLKQVQKIIEEIVGGKNPTVAQNAQNSTLFFLMNQFPDIDEWEVNDLAAAMIKKTHDELGIECSWQKLLDNLIFNVTNAQRILILV